MAVASLPVSECESLLRVAVSVTTMEVEEVGEMGAWLLSCLKFKQSSAKAGSMLRTGSDDTVRGRVGK